MTEPDGEALAEALLRAQIDIDASPDEVWALVSDVRLMPKWSPQCKLMKALEAASADRTGPNGVNGNQGAPSIEDGH